jgi:hypothetical protein
MNQCRMCSVCSELSVSRLVRARRTQVQHEGARYQDAHASIPYVELCQLPECNDVEHLGLHQLQDAGADKGQAHSSQQQQRQGLNNIPDQQGHNLQSLRLFDTTHARSHGLPQRQVQVTYHLASKSRDTLHSGASNSKLKFSSEKMLKRLEMTGGQSKPKLANMDNTCMKSWYTGNAWKGAEHN